MTANPAEFNAIECINEALGDRPGVLQITLNAANTQAHSLKRLPCEAEKTETVTVTTVDAFLDLREAHPDFIKIDVEGYELQVLEGASNTLRSGFVRAMLIEATLILQDTTHTQLEMLRAFLTPIGFHLVGIYDQHVYMTPKQLMFFNALFLCDSIKANE